VVEAIAPGPLGEDRARQIYHNSHRNRGACPSRGRRAAKARVWATRVGHELNLVRAPAQIVHLVVADALGRPQAGQERGWRARAQASLFAHWGDQSGYTAQAGLVRAAPGQGTRRPRYAAEQQRMAHSAQCRDEHDGSTGRYQPPSDEKVREASAADLFRAAQNGAIPALRRGRNGLPDC
jgi:hypothetical protein